MSEHQHQVPSILDQIMGQIAEQQEPPAAKATREAIAKHGIIEVLFACQTAVDLAAGVDVPDGGEYDSENINIFWAWSHKAPHSPYFRPYVARESKLHAEAVCDTFLADWGGEVREENFPDLVGCIGFSTDPEGLVWMTGVSIVPNPRVFGIDPEDHEGYGQEQNFIITLPMAGEGDYTPVGLLLIQPLDRETTQYSGPGRDLLDLYRETTEPEMLRRYTPELHTVTELEDFGKQFSEFLKENGGDIPEELKRQLSEQYGIPMENIQVMEAGSLEEFMEKAGIPEDADVQIIPLGKIGTDETDEGKE